MNTLEVVLIVVALIFLVRAEFDRYIYSKWRRDDSERWKDVLNQVGAAHVDELKRMANMKMSGVPEIPAAVRIPMKPDAEARAHQQVREDTIKKGIADLIELYRRDGLALTEEEARVQVEAMLGGRSPSPA